MGTATVKFVKRQDARHRKGAGRSARPAPANQRSRNTRREPSELTAILNDAFDQIEGCLRHNLDGDSSQAPGEILQALRGLDHLVEERLRKIKARWTQQALLYQHDLPHESASPPHIAIDESEEWKQQEYERFLKENPGKAHFTRAQWERVRFILGPFPTAPEAPVSTGS